VSDMLGQIDCRRQSTSFRLRNQAHTMTLLIAEVPEAAVVPGRHFSFSVAPARELAWRAATIDG